MTLRKVEPFTVTNRVEPFDGEFNLDGTELDYFDSIAVEHSRIAGTRIDYYALNLEKTSRDAVYDEPIERVFDGPFRLYGWLRYPENTTSTGEEGFRAEWNLECWIARKVMEEGNANRPEEGDIIRVWDIPFYKDFKVSSSGYYFDVINVSDDGHMFDSPMFVGYKISLKRRSEFATERKIFPDQVP